MSLAAVYIAQTAAGADDGTSCANAHAVSFFNTAGNWGAGATQIGPGTVVHLCGTFTGTAGSNMLSVQGSGGSGNPITLLFESGAVFTAPYWKAREAGTPAGAIDLRNVTDVVIDGGTNGLIKNTANGSLLANKQYSDGIYLETCTRCEVKNVTIQDLYVQRTASDLAGEFTAGIYVSGTATDLALHHNTISASRMGIRASSGTNGTWTSVSIYNNTISDTCWGIQVGGAGASTVWSNVTIYANEISNWDHWNQDINFYHTDGIIAFMQATTDPVVALAIYNNYIHGALGNPAGTGHIFCSTKTAATVFNNLLVMDAPSGTAIYFHGESAGPHAVYNNTIIGAGTNEAIVVTAESGGFRGTITFKNNIFQNWVRALITFGQDIPGIVAAADANVYWNMANACMFTTVNATTCGGSAGYADFAQWQALGYDANGSTADPNFDGTYHLLASSSAIGRGTNLTSLGIGALDTGKPSAVGVSGLADGVARPASGAWDSGAYELTGGPSVPPPSVPQLQVGAAARRPIIIKSRHQRWR